MTIMIKCSLFRMLSASFKYSYVHLFYRLFYESYQYSVFLVWLRKLFTFHQSKISRPCPYTMDIYYPYPIHSLSILPHIHIPVEIWHWQIAQFANDSLSRSKVIRQQSLFKRLNEFCKGKFNVEWHSNSEIYKIFSTGNRVSRFSA